MAANVDEARRLVLSDGTDVAYWVRGRRAADAPTMVLTNGLTTSLHFWSHLLPRWERSHRVLAWDLPGHGISSPARSARSASFGELADVVVRVMDAAGTSSAVQVGWSTGCQVVLETYRRHPDRCRGLVLLLGSAGRVLSTAELPLSGDTIERLVRLLPASVFGATARGLARVAHAPGGRLLPRALGLIGSGTSRADAASITEHLLRVDMPTVQAMIGSAQTHSAWDVLASVEVPTLIVAGDRDPFAPAGSVGVEMRARCPAAELVRLPEGTHTALFDHAQEIDAAVEGFLRSRLPGG